MKTERFNIWSETRSGIKFRFYNFKEEDLIIEDIAWGLSNLNRYTGQCSRMCLIAAHCLDVASYLKEHLFCRPEIVLAGLLHDGSEAYLNDIPGLLKPYLPEYCRLESKIQDVIYQKFVGFVPKNGDKDTIKFSDTAMLKFEAEQFFESGGKDWTLPDITKPKDMVMFSHTADPKLIYRTYMSAFKGLIKEIEDGSSGKDGDDREVRERTCDNATV